MRTPLRRSAAASLVLVAALAAGCSSGGGSGRTEAAPTASAPSLSAAERVAGEQDGTAPTGGPTASAGSPARPTAPGASDGPGHGPSAPAGPVRPDAALTPATGTFTPQEKKYLSGRVPASADPAAVLDIGRETCQRLSRTARHDKDAAAAAVVAGDVRDAADAVSHLCPDQRPVLDAARGGYPDGTHASPAAGRYRSVSSGPDCAWQITDARGTQLAAGPAPGATAPHTLTVPAGAAGLQSTGCYAWLRA
ncbi:hypothetical protein [Streptomyces fradiae]|uniref:hypothetical protein n=1 Tax=Streptomyces fradiae TaxID=1906 RepID=UPI0036532B7D